jgi:hypothetical protein
MMMTNHLYSCRIDPKQGLQHLQSQTRHHARWLKKTVSSAVTEMDSREGGLPLGKVPFSQQRVLHVSVLYQKFTSLRKYISIQQLLLR